MKVELFTNRECHGDWVPSIGMYRCFLDSTMVPVGEKPTICPNCRRNALPVTRRRPRLRTLTLKQVRLRIGGNDSYFTYEIHGKPTKTPLRSFPS